MLSKEEKTSLLKLARETIQGKLQHRVTENYQPASDTLRELCGAFVTLHKGGALRGCIGLVEAMKPLYKSVHEMALAAAFDDPRFPPLGHDELEEIDIEMYYHETRVSSGPAPAPGSNRAGVGPQHIP
jgi:AmmeMemoRadiSam system protein A